jgi:hypothetical protein
LAALHDVVPASLDGHGNARNLARAYLWRAFLTRRYEHSAGGRSLQDLRGLRTAIADNLPIDQTPAPIFDLEQTPLPDERDLLAARWPKTRDILARGLLAASFRAGGRDIADGQPASASNVVKREYHHLFPDSLLTDVAGFDPVHSYRALNCALITWSTNRNISNKSPLQYLGDRVSRSHMGDAEIRDRLASHLVPFDELANAGPYGKDDGERIRADYERFLVVRARLMLPVLHRLCDGQQPELRYEPSDAVKPLEALNRDERPEPPTEMVADEPTSADSSASFRRGRTPIDVPNGQFVEVRGGKGVYHHPDCINVTGEGHAHDTAALGQRIVRSPEEIRLQRLRPAQCCEPPAFS